MVLAEYDDVIQALSSNRANYALCIGSLPRRPRCGGHFRNLQRPRLPVKRSPVDRVSITDQVSGRLIGPTGLKQLASRPDSCGMFGDVEVQVASPVVAQDERPAALNHVLGDRRLCGLYTELE
jgi:hypothetical protein